MTFLNRRRSLRILSALAFSTVIFAIASPMATVDATQMSPVQSDLLFAEMRSTASFATANFSDAPGEFRFITPVAPNPPDQNADFDADLLPYLTVKICKINGAECSYLKTFTSTTSPDRIRIENKQGRFFIVNWTTDASFDNTPIYRVSVEVPGETLGSVDIPPSAYRQWGRTWPIKFIVEKDAELRIRMLAAAGNTIWDVADNLRSTLGICGEDLRVLLRTTYPNATDAQVQQVVNSVCQNVVIPPTTKIADAATRDALASYDMTSGRLIFATETTLLKNLKTNDVVVSKPNDVAPYGYLRKVTSVQRNKGIYTVETVQATLTEAITTGTLDVSGDILPSDEMPPEALSADSPLRSSESAISETTSESATAASTTCSDSSGSTGYHFECSVSETFDKDLGVGEFNGTGKVTVSGKVFFSAGYDIGAGIEDCAPIPVPLCMDRFEARLRVKQKSEVHVDGQLDATVAKEIVIARKIFKPITFWLGPFPVIIVPVVNLVVGARGEAHITFEFDANSESGFAIGAKWTDENGGTWRNVSEKLSFGGNADANLAGSMTLIGYYKGNAKLLLYGAIGPSFGAVLGGRIDAQLPGDPLWSIYGHIAGDLVFEISIIDIISLGRFDLSYFVVAEPWIADAPNQPPAFVNVTQNFDAKMNVSTLLGPRTGGMGSEGYFDVIDPEGGTVTLSGTSSRAEDNDDFAVVNGKLRVTFRTEGTRVITVTANDTDPDSPPGTQTLNVNVVNSPPEILFTTLVFNFPAEVQYFLTAQVTDPETGRLPCSSLVWEVTAPDVMTESVDNRSCTVAVVFKSQGSRTIKATATDPDGKTFTRIRTVNVTSPPANPAPVIDVNSFLVRAAEGPIDQFYCATGFWCEAPEGAELFNGEVGDYRTPLELSLSVSDPQGETAWVKEWRCLTGAGIYTLATDNGDGTFGCSPFISTGGTIAVFAIVTDGTNDVVSEVRTFTMRQRLNPN